MIAKPVGYTLHADQRLRDRGIRRSDVRFMLARGVRVLISSSGAETVWRVRAYIGTREAAAVFVENAQRYLIITVEWTDEA
jgi:hypothetical protein